MEFANQQPPDYSSAIAAGQGLAFNPLEAQLNAAKVGLAQSAAQGQQIQNQAAVQALNMQKLEMQRRVQFGQDMQGFIKQPTAEGLSLLVGRYPEFATESENAFSTMDAAERRSTATQAGSLAALVANGDIDGATKLAQTRIAADQAAGRDASVPQQMLQLLQSGDPTKQKAVIGLASIIAGSAAGFDKSAEFLKGIGLSQAPEKVSPGESLVNPATGGKVASAPLALTPQALNNADGSQRLDAFNPNPPDGTAPEPGVPAAGPPVAAGAASADGAPTGLQGSIAHVLGNEGGFNPKDANGSPTNFGINFKANAPTLAKMGITLKNFKSLTQDQAAQIYAQKYWPASGAANLPANLQAPYFDAYIRSPTLAKQALAQSGGDPAKFVQIASASFQKMASNPKSGTAPYARAWANRDAKNMAIATGGAATVADGAPQAVGAPGPGQVATLDGGAQSGVLNTKGAEPGHAWNADHTAQIPVPGTDADPASYQSEIDPGARTWLLTGQFPMGGGGMGGGGQLTLGEKNAITKRGMELWQSAGHSPNELATLRQTYTGLGSSLQTATQTASALAAAQEGLQKDANLVLNAQRALAHVAPNNPHGMGIVTDHAPLGGVLSVTMRNRNMLDWYATHGDPQQQAAVKQYRDAVNAYSSSYSKFMSAANGVGGSGAPSDAAKEQSDDLNEEGLGPTALRAHLQTVLAEANNKRQGWLRRVGDVKGQMNSLLPAAPSAQALPPGAKVVGTYKGRRVIEVNGQRLVEQ